METYFLGVSRRILYVFVFEKIVAIPDFFGERSMALKGLSVGTSPASSSWEGRQRTGWAPQRLSWGLQMKWSRGDSHWQWCWLNQSEVFNFFKEMARKKWAHASITSWWLNWAVQCFKKTTSQWHRCSRLGITAEKNLRWPSSFGFISKLSSISQTLHNCYSFTCFSYFSFMVSLA